MEGFIGEIRFFAGNFAPRAWALCEGQLLPIAQNTALFSILGTTYGGDGRSTFALPDFRGRAPVGAGAGEGLTPRQLGEMGGQESVTLTINEMPAHNHILRASSEPGSQNAPENGVLAASEMPIYSHAAGNAPMRPDSMAPAGGNQPHANMQPFLAMNFIICLHGIFPSRG